MDNRVRTDLRGIGDLQDNTEILMSNQRPYLQRIGCGEVTNMPDTSEPTLERMLVQDERFPILRGITTGKPL